MDEKIETAPPSILSGARPVEAASVEHLGGAGDGRNLQEQRTPLGHFIATPTTAVAATININNDDDDGDIINNDDDDDIINNNNVRAATANAAAAAAAPAAPPTPSAAIASMREDFEDIALLPRGTRVFIKGNNRTKASLLGRGATIKTAVGLGGWHLLVRLFSVLFSFLFFLFAFEGGIERDGTV